MDDKCASLEDSHLRMLIRSEREISVFEEFSSCQRLDTQETYLEPAQNENGQHVRRRKTLEGKNDKQERLDAKRKARCSAKT